MPTRLFNKDPDARVDYDIDWTEWLATWDDAIEGATFTADLGLTVDASSHDGQVAKVWLTGGQHGRDYLLVSHVTTVGGRIDERTFTVPVRNR